MKKLWIICMSLVMSVALCFGIAGCNDDKENDSDNKTETVTISVTVNGSAQTNGGTYNAVVGTGYNIAATASNEAKVTASYVFGSETKTFSGTVFMPEEEGSYAFTFSAENAEAFKLTFAATKPVTPVTQYTVTYSLGEHAAESETAPQAQTVDEGTEINLPEAPEAADGYVFAGWSDGTNTYEAGAKYTVRNTATLTALWNVRITYSLGEHADNDATAPAAQSVASGTAITLPAKPSAEYGYLFDGWSDGTTTYNAGATYNVDGPVGFTALWEEIYNQGGLYNSNFETGDITGWTVIEGQPDYAHTSTAVEYFESDANFWDMNNKTVQRHLQEGSHFLVTNDPYAVTVRSADFILGGDGIITFLFGVAKHPECYVAVCDAETDEELIKITNNYWQDPQTAMALLRRVVYAGDYIGQRLYIKLVDGVLGDFGFIAFDDLMVSLTVEEAQEVIAKDKETYRNYRQDVVDSTEAMGVYAKSIVNTIRNYYATLEVINVRSVYFTETISDKFVFDGTADITAYLSEAKAAMLGVAANDFTKSIISINDGTTAYEEGFDEFELISGKTYTVTYRISEPSGKYAEETFTITVSSNYQVLNGNFETGDLTSWTVVSGNVYVSNETEYFPGDVNFWDMNNKPVQRYLQEGNYFLKTDEPQTAIVKSSTFTLGGDGIITFLLGVAKNPVCYVAVCDANTDEELIKVTNNYWKDPQTAMALLRRVVYAGDYIGQKLYIKIVDDAVSDYGFLAFDDLKVSLTVEEAQEVVAKDKETYKDYRQDVVDYTEPMGMWVKSIVNTIRNYYSALDVMNVRTVTITKTISDKAFYAKTEDITSYLSETEGYMLGVAADGYIKSIVSISDGTTTYEEGFDEFELVSGKIYTVTYRISEAGGEYAEETFTITVLTNNQILNGDFETGDLTGWTVLSGEINSENAVSSADYIESWIQHMPYNKSGEYFLANAGLGEHAAWEMKSTNFVLGGKGYISFKVGSQNAFVKVFKADGTQIYSYTCHTFHETAEAFPHYELGGNWITMRTHYADLSEYIGEELYITIGNFGTGAVVWEYGHFDDIITYYDEDFDFTGKQDEVPLTCLDNRVQHNDGETFKSDWIKAENEYVAPATEE